MVEERHAAESLSVTLMVLKTRPALLSATIADAKMMAEALDGVWTHLDRIVQIAGKKPRSCSRTRVSGRRSRNAG
jgi:hypothetical protein